jgi:hypothetical protein
MTRGSYGGTFSTCRHIPAVLAALLAVATAPAWAAGKVTLQSLLAQMTDLSTLTEFPDPPYVCKQFSSYDRASESPADAERWFANYDRGFMLYDGILTRETPYYHEAPMAGRPPNGRLAQGTRVGLTPNRKRIGNYVWVYATAADGRAVEGKIPQGYIDRSAIQMDPQGHVLAEMDGPGCVVRIWSANPQDAGNLRIYLDHARQPLIDAPLQELLGGKWQIEVGGRHWVPFPDPIACERSRGWNLYFPIAYGKHCKICSDRQDFYYHVDYRTYPPGTEVETFRFDRGDWTELDRKYVVNALNGEVSARDPGETSTVKGKLEPGGRSAPLRLQGPRELTTLHLRLRGIEDDIKPLRQLVLVARFDEASVPQVWSPLGDFFGSSPGANAYSSLPLGIDRGKDAGGRSWIELWSNWPMPFEKWAELRLENHGKQPLRFEIAAASKPRTWTEGSMHFHARWRTETLSTRPFRDWTFCRLKGQGVFVGDMLSILNPASDWWGEGDEKIYVDGESFPSWFGTGTEDYFGYAWADPRVFQHAYHNQTRCDGPRNFGRTSLNRFHILDAVPFTRSFRFDMELWHWTANIDVNLAATSYWYARPLPANGEAGDDFPRLDPRGLETIPEPPPPFKVKDALEAEQLRILGKSSDFPADPQDMLSFSDGKWSSNSQLWARPSQAAEWLDLEVPAPADGKYHVLVYLTKAPDYGIVQFTLDGEKLGQPIDCFSGKGVIATGPVDLGTVALKKGETTLRIETSGTNPKSVGVRYMWGLDCIVLKPAAR